MTAVAIPGQLPLPSYWPVVRSALLTACALTLTLFAWGMLARLDAALVSHGVLHAESERKTVEHLEGGILAELLVRSGDMVEAGQVVALLDTRQVDERLDQLTSESDARRFAIWRLEAEQAGRPVDPTSAPDALTGSRASYIAGEIALKQARERAHAAQTSSLIRQIAKLQGQISASEGQRNAADAQLALWHEERELVASLVDRGTVPRRQLLDFDRAIAAMEGERDEHAGLVRAAQEDILRAEADMEALSQQRQAEIAASLTEARAVLLVLASQIRAQEDIRDRHLLRASQAGRVVEILTVTPGAVVGSGQPLMEILPRDDRLVALFRLAPDSIDSVQEGLEAQVRLTAYKRSDAPLIDGEVVYVSADLLEDPQTGTSYFEGRVALDPASIESQEGISVTAGMPVEVTLTIGARRAGDYLLEPILRHLRRAFREE